MPIRTVKLMGKLWGDPANPASINVVWNGIPVFSGTATTVAGNFSYIDSSQLDELCSWSMDTSISGPVPLAISVSNGTLGWGTLLSNYTNFVNQLQIKPGTAWPATTPDSADSLISDANTLDDSGFQAKYGVDKTTACGAVESVIVQGFDVVFADIAIPRYISNFKDDGKHNVKIDGSLVFRRWADNDIPPGATVPCITTWIYRVPPGSTLTCDVNVVPAQFDVGTLPD